MVHKLSMHVITAPPYRPLLYIWPSPRVQGSTRQTASWEQESCTFKLGWEDLWGAICAVGCRKGGGEVPALFSMPKAALRVSLGDPVWCVWVVFKTTALLILESQPPSTFVLAW